MQHDFILLDRSGSMATGGKWAEALTAINAYVKTLADDGVDTGVTRATFDSMDQVDFEVIRDRITPPTWRPVSDADATPRGWTPLNDAVVRMVSLAQAGKYDKVAIIIVTDGEENASREDQSGSVARRMLDQCRKKGWQVIMLGADMNAKEHEMQVGNANNDVNASLNVASGHMVKTMRATAGKRFDYGATGQSMVYSESEKAELGKK
jgi:hypothetical protein